MRLAAGLACVVLGAAMSGCGGGGQDTETLDLPSEAARDGSVRSNGTVLTGVDISDIFTGDDDFDEPGVGSRQFLSFALLGLPSDATLVSATLQVKQEDPDGNAFPTHGPVVVEHVDYGLGLDAGDYGLAPVTPGAKTFSLDTASGVRSIDVTEEVLADLVAARTRSQFRLRFQLVDSDDDGGVDRVHFRDADNSSSTTPPPVLVIEHRP